MELFYFIYMSQATKKMNEGELDELLAQCLQNNKQLNLTGMLLFIEGGDEPNFHGRFVQVLEGPKQTVLNLFETIRKDTRHKQVIELFSHTLKERNFADWTMGFKRLESETALPKKVKNWFDFNQFQKPATNVKLNVPLTYLKSFYDLYKGKSYNSLH